MQRTPCSYCSLPQATEEDDTKLPNRQMETGTHASDLELFGEPLCWHPLTGEHPNGGELIAALKFWRERATLPEVTLSGACATTGNAVKLATRPTIAILPEDLQQAEAKLKAAFDEFRAAALKAGEVMP